jgi:catechol 2,3-dioxygenase-like lactoylglutathione lyase family enzyme
MFRYIAVLLLVTLVSACSWFNSPSSRVDNPIVTGIHFVGMTVRDLDKSEQLYRQAAKVEVVRSDTFKNQALFNELLGRENAKLETRLIRGVNAQLLMMQFEQPSELAKASSFVDSNGPGIAHLAFQTTKDTNTYPEFLNAGATHVGALEMWENPKTHVSYAYVRDHDNTLVEIEHVDIEALALPKPPKNERRIRHISLATTDMQRLIDFYSILLETKNPRRIGRLINLQGDFVDSVSGLKDSQTEMAWFQTRNLELEIIQYHNPPATPLAQPRPLDATGYNMIVFEVTDLNTTKELLTKAGATIVSEGLTLNGNSILFARDPDKNLIGFQVLTKDSPFSAGRFKDNGMG